MFWRTLPERATIGGMGEWSDFFVAVAGAAAALAGLIIVAVSVNVADIIKYPQLPTRAAAAITSLVSVLLLGVTGLAPQSPAVFGAEVAVIGVIAWLVHSRASRFVLRLNRAESRPPGEGLRHILFGQLQTLPILLGGVLIAIGMPAGPYLLLGGVVAVFAFTVIEAWVLLIEILR